MNLEIGIEGKQGGFGRCDANYVRIFTGNGWYWLTESPDGFLSVAVHADTEFAERAAKDETGRTVYELQQPTAAQNGIEVEVA